jgi:hypothetical protein
VVVTELAAEHRHQAEGQGVAGDDPLQLGRAGAGVPGDRGQGDVDTIAALVEQDLDAG